MAHRNLTLLMIPLLAACGGSSAQKEEQTANTSGQPPEVIQKTLAEVGLDPTALDKSGDPCDDFYQYACGGWLASHEIPADRSSYGRFYEIMDRNQATLKSILDEASSGKDLSPQLSRVRDFYGACMNEEEAGKTGKKAIEPLLATIKKVRNDATLDEALTALHAHGIWPLWSLSTDADFADPTKTILFVDQSGLGLPNREYYLSDDPNMKKAREAYVPHVQRMLELAGYKTREASKAAAQIMELETRLAKASKSEVELRDPKGVYNKVDRAGLAKAVPNMDWKAYFKGLGHENLDGISITAPKFFAAVNAELESVPAKTWQYYLTWHVVDGMAPFMGKAFDDENFKMVQVLSGQQEQRPRWKRCLSAIDGAIGELIAQPFVDDAFPGDSKTAAEKLVLAISAAFKADLESLPWMSATTKEKAEEKRDAMAYLIGYPSKWKSYDFEISPTSYAANMLAAAAWEQNRQLDKVGKPFDREEWYMTPQTVNAYYTPLANQMVFPAGILQTPFFDRNASVAVNLGAMGMIVGHELTHGFDDSGAQFTAHGKMENWWQESDLTQFKARGECVAKQYSSYEPLPGMHINGELTLGENIADIGGVKAAFNAYRSLREGKQPVVADGFTEDQQFFLAVGQAWCAKDRDATLRKRLVTDPHSPPRYRIIGALSDLPAFAEAFQCKQGTRMNPKNSCQVW